MEIKKCLICEKIKNLSDFNNQSKTKDGKQSYCKICQRLKTKEYYDKNKSVLNKKRVAWHNSSLENKTKDRESYYKWKNNNKKLYENIWKSYNLKLKIDAFTIVSGSNIQCLNCNCDKLEFLEINHKYCNGSSLKESGSYLYSKIRTKQRSIDDLDLRCKLCNNLHYLQHKFGKQPYKIIWNDKFSTLDENFNLISNSKKHWKHNLKIKLEALKIVGKNSIFCVSCNCDKIDFLEINHKNSDGYKLKESGSHLYHRIVKGDREIDDLDLRCKLCNNLHYLEFKFGKQPYKILWDNKS